MLANKEDFARVAILIRFALYFANSRFISKYK